MLIVFGGLPGTGKSTIARRLADEIGGIWIRVDSIEQAIRASGACPGALDDAGYLAAQAVAEDNLRLGRIVIADSVNPWMETRDAWRDVGRRADARVVEIEIVCSDRNEHRRRVENRTGDIHGLVLPDWSAVTNRDYRAWSREHLVIDTAGRNIADSVAQIRSCLSKQT